MLHRGIDWLLSFRTLQQFLVLYKKNGAQGFKLTVQHGQGGLSTACHGGRRSQSAAHNSCARASRRLPCAAPVHGCSVTHAASTPRALTLCA